MKKLRFGLNLVQLFIILYVIINPRDELTRVLAAVILPLVLISMYDKLGDRL